MPRLFPRRRNNQHTVSSYREQIAGLLWHTPRHKLYRFKNRLFPTASQREIRAERVATSRQFGGLYNELLQLLYVADPLGINFGFNPNEYANEVCTILPRLGACQAEADVVHMLIEEFDRWFWPGALKPDLANHLAAVLFRASCRHGITRWPGWETRTCTLEQA